MSISRDAESVALASKNTIPQTNSKVIKKGVQNEKLKGWKFSSADKATVKKIIEDANKPKKKQ